MTIAERQLNGWSGIPKARGPVSVTSDRYDLQRTLAGERSFIARGAGKSYGDAAQGETLTVSTACLSRIFDFDRQTGIVRCESGVTLRRLIDRTIHAGWIPCALPGTSAVTIGGMIAADVHGKDQRINGSFGTHVLSMTMLLGDGSIVECDPGNEADLFRSTIGGMGLTGLILEATFRLQPIPGATMRTEWISTGTLGETIQILDATSQSSAVAWVDATARGARLGRGVVQRGVYCAGTTSPTRARPQTSVEPSCYGRWPRIPLLKNTTFVRLVNGLYRFSTRAAQPREESLERALFPLDRAARFFSMYGSSGFVQFHCVTPRRAGDAVKALLTRISESDAACPLVALKSMGDRVGGMMSFPMDGLSLAADLPMDSTTPELYRDLEAIVRQAGGRIYLAKDALMTRDTFEAGYPELDRFRSLLADVPGSKRMRSRLSARLEIT